MQKSCDDINEMLVDYADGQLSASQASEVAEHLAKCERCRTVVKGLQKSLNLASAIWQDGLAEIEGVRIPTKRRGSQFRWRRFAAVAASILVIAAIWVVVYKTTRPKEARPTFAEIERRISESGSAARLLAAANLLAEYPDAKSILQQQYRYIAETYPQTPAATKAKLRIQ